MFGVIGTILAMGAIAGYTDKDSRKAYPAMDEKKVRAAMDAECARYGIKGQNGKFTEQWINMIAAINSKINANKLVIQNLTRKSKIIMIVKNMLKEH